MNKYLSILIILLVSAIPAFAVEVSGDVTVGGRFIDGNGSEKSAKFLEYRDLDDQLTSDLDLRMSQDGYYFTVEGENLGYDDQHVEIGGGVFGQFRFSLFYDELTHNYSLDDRSLYSGIGSAALTVNPAVTVGDASTWMPLDYSVERQQVGARLELSFDTPFFVAVEVAQTEKEGLIPWGVNIDATSGGADSAEIPAPIDTKTTNMTVKTGYRTKALFAQLDASFSSFDNDRDRIDLPNTASPDFANAPPSTVYFAPENNMMQFGGQLVLRGLPVNSVLSLRASHAINESDAPAAGIKDGELTYTKAAIDLRSRPTSSLDTELNYSFLQKDNKAAIFDYNGDMTHVFEYTKQHAGAAAGYRINRDNRIRAGYDFLTVDRSAVRFDAEETDEHTLFAEWKNSTLESTTARLRYEYMTRSSDFNGASAVDVVTDPNTQIYALIRPFDVADKDQHKVRLLVDFSPVEKVDFGFEFNLQDAEYDKTVFGRNDERGYEFIVDTSIALPFNARLYGYAGFEQTKTESNHVRWSANTTADVAAALAADVDANNYHWALERSDISKSFGVKLDLPLLKERLNLSAAFDYQQNDGKADFTATQVVLEDVTEYDDYEKKAIDLKAEYAIRDNMVLIAGYSYEKYEFDDLGYNGYFNVSSNNDYLTGAYADMDYEANIGFVALNYKF